MELSESDSFKSLIANNNISNDSTYNMNSNGSLIYQEVDLYDQLLSESKIFFSESVYFEGKASFNMLISIGCSEVIVTSDFSKDTATSVTPSIDDRLSSTEALQPPQVMPFTVYVCFIQTPLTFSERTC